MKLKLGTELMNGRLRVLLGGFAIIAIVTAIVLGICLTEKKPTTGAINGHEWVDLGLSVKWATCNVGASSPSAYGDYYAWGETTAKSDYTEENYEFKVIDDRSVEDVFEKYSTLDKKKKLELSDDAASVNWGGKWRMPTWSEWMELDKKCLWVWTEHDGTSGYKVTSKKNGNSIFLPIAGCLHTYLDHDGKVGYYWSSTLASDTKAWYTQLRQGDVEVYLRMDRYLGLSVRPVYK